MLKQSLKKLLGGISFLEGNLLVLIVSWMFFYFTFAISFSFESPFIRELGAPPYVIGLMGSFSALLMGLVKIPGAYIADKYGRKQIIATMTFAVSFSYLFYIFAPDWRFILFGMIISNLSLVYEPALRAILADSIPPDKRGVGFAAANILPSITIIFAPAVAGYLVDAKGLIPGMRMVYVIVFLCTLSAAFIRLFFLKETLQTPQRLKLSKIRTTFRDSLGSILEAWQSTSKSLRFLTLAALISAFEEPVFRMFASLYVFDVVMATEIEWGIATGAWTAASLIIGFPLGKVVDKIGRKKAILIAYIVFIPSSIVFILSRNFIQLLLSNIIFAIGDSLMMPAYSALWADMIPKEKRGRIGGAIGTLNVIGMVPASAIAGYLYHYKPEYPFIFTLILGIIAALVILLKVKEPKTRES
jgi:MFS family permease